MWPAPDMVVKVTAPEYLPVLVTAPRQFRASVFECQALPCPKKMQFEHVHSAAVPCSGTGVRGSALPYPEPAGLVPTAPSQLGLGFLETEILAKYSVSLVPSPPP